MIPQTLLLPTTTKKATCFVLRDAGRKVHWLLSLCVPFAPHLSSFFPQPAFPFCFAISSIYFLLVFLYFCIFLCLLLLSSSSTISQTSTNGSCIEYSFIRYFQCVGHFGFHCGLNVCFLPKFALLNSNPPGISIRRWALWEVIRSWRQNCHK